MRLWDLHPGYLNRESLLGEHRELHALVSVIYNKKKGYSVHPETLRWKGLGWALTQRHKAIKREMELRGYSEKTPVFKRALKGRWPSVYIDSPFQQVLILKEKYKKKEQGRISLPKNSQEMWSHYKYSVMARSIQGYKETGRLVAGSKVSENFEEIALRLTDFIRIQPEEGGIRNAVQHMWGHISDKMSQKPDIKRWGVKRLLEEVQKMAIIYNEPYLLNSTALSELALWL